MILSLNLLDNNTTITSNILQALIPEINSYMTKSVSKLRKILPSIIRNAITNTPEYDAILNGKLQYELGISDPAQKLAGLLDLWSTNISITYNAPRASKIRIVSSFSVNMIRVDFSDVLYSDYAIVVDGLRGYSLPWLEWLLLYGNKTIVKNSKVVFGPNRSSRTGFALMRESSESWKIPSQYSGTIDDNWITRAIDRYGNDIEQAIDSALQT